MDTTTPRSDEQPGPSATDEWHYAVGEKRHGPVSEQDLVARIKSRELGQNTKLWKEGLPKWILLGNTDFCQFLAKAAPPPLDEVESSGPQGSPRIIQPQAQNNLVTLHGGVGGIKQFKIYENALGIREAVKQGWSWPGFFFTFIWAFIKKMHGLGGSVLGGLAFLLVLFAALELSAREETVNALQALFGVVEIGLAIVFGVNGNRWREFNLASRGYVAKATVSAETDESALAAYLETRNQG
jgi:hypothetical protein